MDVSEYRTVQGKDIRELDQQVNQAIEEGFQPFGNPYLMIKDASTRFYTQAMIKGEEEFSASERVPLDKVKLEAVFHALSECNWNRTRAARRLGISRRGLIYILKTWQEEENTRRQILELIQDDNPLSQDDLENAARLISEGPEAVKVAVGKLGAAMPVRDPNGNLTPRTIVLSGDAKAQQQQLALVIKQYREFVTGIKRV
jgi:hypothetical protein